MKHTHKFYNQKEIPWVQLVWFKYYENKVRTTHNERGGILLVERCSASQQHIPLSHKLFCWKWSNDMFLDWQLVTWHPGQQLPRLASFARNQNASMQEIVSSWGPWFPICVAFHTTSFGWTDLAAGGNSECGLWWKWHGRLALFMGESIHFQTILLSHLQHSRGPPCLQIGMEIWLLTKDKILLLAGFGGQTWTQKPYLQGVTLEQETTVSALCVTVALSKQSITYSSQAHLREAAGTPSTCFGTFHFPSVTCLFMARTTMV